MSTSAGTPPEPSNGSPPPEATPRKDLRDSLWGRALILGVLLVFTLVVSKTCASNRDDITQAEAIDLAIANASFVPCEREICRQVRYLNQGIPPVGYWGVVLSERVNAQGQPNRTESFLVNASTGDVSKE
ncbi:MAG TPA: hypothetical protein VFU99_09240 [Gaiellaceae bacterium]|nr:hypothetical protein [Gaiellaceae bacterium]